jgi:sugar lactone lactonase YvrE
MALEATLLRPMRPDLRRMLRRHRGTVAILLSAGLASPAWASVISKGTVSHPGGNFCTTFTVATFVSSGADVVLIYGDLSHVNPHPVPVTLTPPAAETRQFSYLDGVPFGWPVTVITYAGLTAGLQYTFTYSMCGATAENGICTIIEDGCPTSENPQGPVTCRWEDIVTSHPVVDFGETILIGNSVDRSVRLVNTNSQTLSTTVSIGCPEITIVGNPAVSIPAGGQASITLRYTPTIDNTVVTELTPTCLGTLVLANAIGPRLVLGTSSSVLRRKLDGGADVEMTGSVSSAHHKDFAADAANNDVYMAAHWTTSDNMDGIYKGTLDGSFSIIVATVNPWSADFDPVANKVYWGGVGAIRRANADGSNVEHLPTPITFASGSPVDIVIDAQARLLYWTEGTSTITIRRATLDGQGEVILATIPGGGNPRLGLDRAAGRLYWSENTTGRIRRMHTDGTNVQTLLTPESVTPVALAVDAAEGKVYWSDAGTSSLHRVDLGGENHQEIVTGISGASGLALIRFPVAETERVFWADDTSDWIRSVLKDGSNAQTLVTSAIRGPRGLAIDPEAGKMYWVDQGARHIRRANLDGSSAQILVSTGVLLPEDIALDVAGGKMYWTDSAASNRILRANLNGTGVETVIDSGLFGVRGIAVDPVHRVIYWTEIDDSGGCSPTPCFGNAGIYRLEIDGSSAPGHIVADLIHPPLDLELDIAGGKMYWTAASEAGTSAGSVQRANLDGTDVEDLFSTSAANGGKLRFIALDLGARKVYWSSANAIRRRNMDGSGGGFGLGAAEDVVLGLASVHGVAVGVRAGYPTPTDVEERPTVAPRVHLEVPRPNPFNPSTTIAYTHGGGVLDVAIYDVRGRLVRRLITGTRAAGSGTVVWDGKGDSGNISPSGLYFVQLYSAGVEHTAKAVLVR